MHTVTWKYASVPLPAALKLKAHNAKHQNPLSLSLSLLLFVICDRATFFFTSLFHLTHYKYHSTMKPSSSLFSFSFSSLKPLSIPDQVIIIFWVLLDISGIFADMGDHNSVNLPPGFRFYPTDEELVVHFLQRKAALLPCHPDVIPDLDLYPYDPWELNGKALGEGNQWYFYSRRTQNRNTSNGYWKPMGVEEPVFNSVSRRVGMKKYFVFHVGEAPAGIKTNWILQEYRLSDCGAATNSSSSSRSSSKRRGHPKDYSRWVVCRVYERSCGDDDDGTELSCLDEVFLSLDDLDEISLPN